jgi:hypothetical protein
MLLFKPSTRLGFLGVYALVGLAGCAIWPTSRVPEGPHGAAPEVVVTPAPASPASDRTPDPTPSPQTAVIEPSVDAPGAPTISANGPVIAPPAPPASESTTGPMVVPPSPAATSTAPRLSPPAASEVAPGSISPVPPETAPSAESNGNQIQPQRPLNAPSPGLNPGDVNQSASGQPTVSVSGQLQVIPPVASAQAPGAQSAQANQPPSALAKLKARFHHLVQPTPKPPLKPLNSDKAAEPVVTPRDPSPPAVAIRIPLPRSDEGAVARDSSPTLHGLYPADESPVAVATPTVRGMQPAVMPAAPIQTASAAPTNESPTSATPGQIEQWPYSPQAAISVSTTSHAPATANDFDSMPVEEYRTAVAKATGDANSLPSFDQAASDSKAAESQSVTTANPASELHVVPKALGPSAEGRPALIPIDQAESHASVGPQATPNTPADLQERSQSQALAPYVPPAPAAVGSATPASTTEGPAPAVQMSGTTPAPAVPVRSPQWIGGRYGQPAWMSAPAASPAGN